MKKSYELKKSKKSIKVYMKFRDLNKKKAEEKKEAVALPKKKQEEEPLPQVKHPEQEKEAVPVPNPSSNNSGAVASPVPALPAGRRRKRISDSSSPVFKKADEIERHLDEAAPVYSTMMDIAKKSDALLRGSYCEIYADVEYICHKSAEVLKNNPCLLNYSNFATADSYLYAHAANVCILSQTLGIEMGFSAEELKLLSISAFLHDAGMIDFEEIAKLPRQLTKAEFARIQMHSEKGAEKIDRIIDMDYKVKDDLKNTILGVHERIDSSGYPAGLSGEDINLFSQIIGIADVYEAMTHPKAWRKPFHPHYAVKHIIGEENKKFSHKITKTLLNVLSIYPLHSMVRLSTGEIARVVFINRKNLTRPVVEILLDADFMPADNRMINLLEYPLTSIDGPVEEQEISAKNSKFLARMEMSRWWTEW
ncbi:MAG: HD domain-containing protein [Elusimicrobia bacterium]|nr:HD domain-containing protein [Elusimicrobiota bacterium]